MVIGAAEQDGRVVFSRSLTEQAARVAWDDRRVVEAMVEDLREAKVQEFLRDAS